MGNRKRDEIERIKRDFSQAYFEKGNYYGRQKESSCHQILAELKDALLEFEADKEKNFHVEWKIVDENESHIYVTNMTNGHRYHISVVIPAAVYVDVYCLLDDGTEVEVLTDKKRVSFNESPK